MKHPNWAKYGEYYNNEIIAFYVLGDFFRIKQIIFSVFYTCPEHCLSYYTRKGL
jgi:hypothetical protein